MAITTTQIRELLDNPAAKSVPDNTIEANLDRSKRIVDNVKDPLAKQDDVEDAKRAVAVWLTYGSYMEGITQLLGNISVADKTKLDHLRTVAELFLNQISLSMVDLDLSGSISEQPIGIDPSVFKLTTTETYSQS